MGSKLVDSTGTVYAAKPGSPTIGDSFDLTLNLPPGEKATRSVIFDVPESAKITAVQYEMNTAGLRLELDQRARASGPSAEGPRYGRDLDVTWM
ncbi:hypothetical protein ACFWY6_14600 [Streptomyces sp. NPDC059037]|uniref:hypothetical protein n=1 Tax=Streptomyces sp. NPDC059037 TaxID=3346710 RepID=UPI0036CC206C